MKRIKNGYGVIAVICLLTAHVGAEEQFYKGQDVDLFFGETTGLDNNNWLSEACENAPTATSWSLVGVNSFKFHADWLWHNYDLIKTRTLLESLSVYYGVGGRMKLKDTHDRNDKENIDEGARLGIRSPLGISYAFQEKSVELFAEVVPILDILPEARLGMGVGVGARYYFSLL
jgi:hypothetical protein